MSRKINKDYFINSWNKKRAKKDGHFFQKLENFLPRDRMKFIRFFSYYYIKDLNIYIKDILDDEFRIYEFNEYQLCHIKEGVKTDFRAILNFADRNNKTIKDVFRCDKIPPIFKLYDIGRISVYSLIIFNEIFNLTRDVNINKLDVLDTERYEVYQNIIFNKFRFVVNDYLFNDRIDWIATLKAG